VRRRGRDVVETLRPEQLLAQHRFTGVDLRAVGPGRPCVLAAQAAIGAGRAGEAAVAPTGVDRTEGNAEAIGGALGKVDLVIEAAAADRALPP
jgi:hypothetical protein